MKIIAIRTCKLIILPTEWIVNEKEKAETKKYIAGLEADIMPIDMLISFTESDKEIEVLGQ